MCLLGINKKRGFTPIRTRLCRNLVGVRGFTLIELLVVISIIGILASLLVANYTRSVRMASDTQRKSDMNQYRIAIENYSSANNSLYPREGATICADVELCTNPGDLTNFISTCPKDPKSTPACSGSPDRYYDYEVTTARDKYVMYVYGGFEAEANKTWVVCWDGKVGVTNNAWAGVGGIEEFCPNVHNL